MKKYDYLVIGGGIFGLYSALYLSKHNKKVCILEKENQFMKKASIVNQARLHAGYHYPRSDTTVNEVLESQEDFINESLSDWINDFVKVKPYDREYAIAKWKHNVRKVALVASGYYKIDNLINKVLLSFEKIDKALITAYNLEIDNKDKFALIKKDVDNIALLTNKFNKNVNNVISKSIRKINQTFYYYEKTGKFLNLFLEAFEIISNDKFGLQKNNSPNNINAILKKLSILLNSIDKNENKPFAKSIVETRIFTLYNRIVGYRHTSRGIAMLHSVIELMIKKMIAMKSKTSTLKISEQKYSTDDLNNQDPGHIYAAKI